MFTPIVYVECGCCGHYHKQEYCGDCRNDAERFTLREIMHDVEKRRPVRIISIDEQVELEG